MSGEDVIRNSLVMERVSRFLGEADLDSLVTSSEIVSPIVNVVLEKRRESELRVNLGGGELPPLSRHTKIVNVILSPGPFCTRTARSQLMRVRHLVLNLLVDFHFNFTSEIAAVLSECNIVVNELKVSPISLWSLQSDILFEDIKKLHVRPEPDAYERGLCRLVGNNCPTEIQIPVDYLDFPEVLPMLQRTLRLTISEPRQHIALGDRFIKPLQDINYNLTHLDVRPETCANSLIYSDIRFPALKKLSITGNEVYLYAISVHYPSLQTLEIRHARRIYTSVDDRHVALRKLKLVMKDELLLHCSDLRPQFPSMTTFKISGHNYTSDSLDVFFKQNCAEKVTIGGDLLSPERFDSFSWIRRLKDCRELRIVPEVWFRKLNWDDYVGGISRLRKLELLHLKNFKAVTPLEIPSMTVEDCKLRCEFQWPWNCIRSFVVQAAGI